MIKRIRVSIATAAALMTWAFAAPTLLAAGFPQTVQIDTGVLSGMPSATPSVTVFKGIPFAAPPVGALRWKPPVAPAKWGGVRKADHFGPACMQINRTTPIPGSENTRNPPSEDCLYLDVWTPAQNANDRLPVMVWIYGGGFMAGSASNPQFDGEGLAAKGVVRVQMNYRLGIFGFLSHPELDKESQHGVSGNYGLLDQIAALQWVQRNIAAFGGDPKNVTIFGQSAGGGSVHFLSLSPLGKGLFQRAISENGLMYHDDPYLQERSPSAYKTIKEAEADNLAYLRKAGSPSIKQLRAMSGEQINALPRTPFPPAFFSPILDGWLLPKDFGELYAEGKQSNVPFMAGWTSVYYPDLKISVAQYQKWAKARFGELAGEFLKLYPAATDDEAAQQIEQSARDSYRTSTFEWARVREKGSGGPYKTFIYYFNHGLPGSSKEKFGAGAGAEIPYVMNSLSKLTANFKQVDRELAETMSSYWANFAKTGDPNGKGLPAWPQFNAQKNMTMQLGDGTQPIQAATDPRFDFFKRYFASHPKRCGFAQDCSIDMQ